MPNFFLDRNGIEAIRKEQRDAIKVYSLYAGLVVIVGVCVLFTGSMMGEGEVSKSIVQIGGGFVSTLSGFQIKEIMNRRSVIAGLNAMESVVNGYTVQNVLPSPEQMARIDKMMEEVLRGLLKLPS